MVLCWNCLREYEPVLKRPIGDNRPIQAIFPDAPKWQREQHISGICSDQCWDEYMGKDPKKRAKITSNYKWREEDV